MLDEKGDPFKVVKFATDVTGVKTAQRRFAGQIEAIGKSQAVTEFAMDGTIRRPTRIFFNAVGYALRDIVGHHQHKPVDAAERNGAAYREFWRR